MAIAVISDTHMPKGARRLPTGCLERLSEAELIIHAGDWSTIEVLREIEAIGPPVRGVAGNVEGPEVRALLPERLELEWSGSRIGVVHDAGPKRARLARMRRAFPECDLVVFGHSHMPLIEADDDGFQILNPGSPTERRRAPGHTMAVIESTGGELRPRLLDL